MPEPTDPDIEAASQDILAGRKTPAQPAPGGREITDALLFVCDEAACKEDPMFYEIFAMDDRWDIIRAVLGAAGPALSPHECRAAMIEDAAKAAIVPLNDAQKQQVATGITAVLLDFEGIWNLAQKASAIAILALALPRADQGESK